MRYCDPGEADEGVVEVINQELMLLQPGIRADQDVVASMLHEGFREFGASGRVWNRSEIVDALSATPGVGAEAEDMRAVRLGDDIVFLTYLARTPERASLRSSVWLRDGGGWRLFFHQGTLCP
jgi:ribonuclease HI